MNGRTKLELLLCSRLIRKRVDLSKRFVFVFPLAFLTAIDGWRKISLARASSSETHSFPKAKRLVNDRRRRRVSAMERETKSISGLNYYDTFSMFVITTFALGFSSLGSTLRCCDINCIGEIGVLHGKHYSPAVRVV